MTKEDPDQLINVGPYLVPQRRERCGRVINVDFHSSVLGLTWRA